MVKANNNKQGNKKKNGGAKNGGARAPARRGPKTVSNRSRGGTPSGVAKTQHIIKHGLNAFSKVHIPLPVSTGSYHVIRTVKTINTTGFLSLFAPCRTEHGDWRTASGFTFPAATSTLNGVGTLLWANENPFPTTGVPGNDVECVPASYSIQVTCATSLLNAAGVSWIGRMKTGYTAPASTDARQSKELADSLLSYAPLKMVSNSELVQRPKQVNAIPTNATELSEFTPVFDDGDVAVNWAAQNYGFAGFAPIVVYNPTGAALQINICTEWRVRLDPFNPMHASGTHYPPTPPGIWHAITSAAENAGHGVEELAGVAAGGYALTQAGGFGAMVESLGTFAAGALPSLEALMPLLLL